MEIATKDKIKELNIDLKKMRIKAESISRNMLTKDEPPTKRRSGP